MPREGTWSYSATALQPMRTSEVRARPGGTELVHHNPGSPPLPAAHPVLAALPFLTPSLTRPWISPRWDDSSLSGPPVTSAPCSLANPESFGLYFVLGVCFGLLLTLCLLVISISCAPRSRPRTPAPHRDPRSSTLEPEDEDDEDEDTMTRLGPDDTLQGQELSTEPDGPLSVNVFTSAEELERAQRLEERERILREIWRTGQPDLLGSGTLGPGATATLGRMHYY
ncbi:protein eva-1 homolog B isoform X1 [Rattus norvegicus]|uniref:Eva-1 homolog B n=1 Tax=Rattus norvegicus TaxID=10116 RepID=B2RZB3_RAT|nr:protein eva-1 homolog B isoform 1 [Rattus norvegicus]XP_006238951.1 protein eva-1 homolog B isoform X1 [Rattus norvegicus]AAI67091.1 Fam176b protein [Rattus norvegicus]|eukprot:NP_001102149.2 protein eva-1 homolog B [Rattus norvegicus]